MVILAPTLGIMASQYDTLGWVDGLVGRYAPKNLGNLLVGLTIVAVFLFMFLLRRFRDVNRQIVRQREGERRARALARRDTLTGLHNRRHLNETLAEEIMAANANAEGFALFLLDLDRFKPVNDLLGHAAGDEVLRRVGERISNIAMDGSCVARIGGDEFAILLPRGSGREEASGLAEKILGEFEQPIDLGGKPVRLGASIGIAFYPSAGEDAEALFRHADVALYNAKRQGRNRFCLYAEEMEDSVRNVDSLAFDIRRGLRGNEFIPYFQPIVDLRSGRVVGMEALARWQHPVHGIMEPVEFISVAEALHIVGDVTFQIMRAACIEALKWDRRLFLTFNFSQSQLRDQWLPERMLALLTETGFPATRIEVEITENSLVEDIDDARAILYSLKNLGMRISLDDFGIGYSSLIHLRDLPLDKIKIDRSFITSLRTDIGSAKIVSAILGLVTSLGLPTVAEGVESEEVARILTDLGCAYGQGYLYSVPLTADVAYARYCKPGLEATIQKAVQDTGAEANLDTAEDARAVAAQDTGVEKAKAHSAKFA
ncbi:MAG: EAL domain-containing protein [Hyphomicrobiales bacterium]|nr:EAL domain-containing protein [Hyphomicrobiales bacterium]